MNEKKTATLIVYLFGIIAGAISFFLNNYLLSLASTLAIYFGLYLAFHRVIETKEFFSSAAIGYFGLWIIVWTILINLIG